MVPEERPSTATELPRFRDVVPSRAAHDELRWFFNQAEILMEQPSNYLALLTGASPVTLAAVERRAEARHAADKIRVRLGRLRVGPAMTLEALYTERAWPPRVERALGVLAGPVVASASLRALHLRALMQMQTRAQTALDWIDERLVKEGAGFVAEWKVDAEILCAIAVNAYELEREREDCCVPPDCWLPEDDQDADTPPGESEESDSS